MKKRVMIGTPCYSGQIDVWYANSLMNTIKASAEKDIEITPIWVSFDALVQRARNDTISIALNGEFDDLIWIDSDIEWQPEWIFKLLSYTEDCVGGTYRKKGDKIEYVVRQTERREINPANGLIEVDGLGTGFVKMSKKAMQYLWDISTPYIDPKDDKERRLIFDVVIENGSMVSEDIHAFNKLREGGFKIWLDPTMTCNHSGPYKFKGDFNAWYHPTDTPIAAGKQPTRPLIRPNRQL